MKHEDGIWKEAVDLITALMFLDAFVCIVLIASIVLQSSKSAGMGGSISGGADAVFGGKAKGLDGFLAKVTMFFAALFGIITLSIVKLTA